MKQPLPPTVYTDAALPSFEREGETIAAALQPMSGSVVATLYGEESVHMLLMLTQARLTLKEGMGVCVDGEAGECDYRIAAPPERWGTHQRVALKRL